jgi:NAD(P)-dependent dehydrogenase (short-subunit alcohol dehydrogenase family)
MGVKTYTSIAVFPSFLGGKLQDKVAVVTGAASGFGWETTRLFLREGAKVVMADVDSTRLEREASILGREFAGKVRSAQVDVSSSKQVEALFGETERSFGSVDVLVNSAGIWLLPQATVEIDDEAWDRTIGVNLKGTFLCCKYALKQMIPRRKGSIVNFGSIMGMVGYAGDAVYCASKGGILLLTKALALEVAANGVRVNCVCPGNSDTPMFRKFLDSAPDPRTTEREELARIPLGRFGTTQDIAGMVLFLSSEDALYLTGAAIPVDGGYTAQ